VCLISGTSDGERRWRSPDVFVLREMRFMHFVQNKDIRCAAEPREG
jgi:hypothetical protein